MALIYYLSIDGIYGDTTSDSHKGAFDVIDYSFDVEALAAAAGGGGGSATPTFSLLSIDLDVSSGLTALLKDIATGKHIRSIELQGVLPDGQTVYDLRLGDVTLASYHDTSAGHDYLLFDYQQVSLTTRAQNPDGTLGTPVTFSYNVATGTTDASIPAPDVPAGSVSGSDAQTYYLTIDGMFGDSAAHTGAFDVIGYSFDVNPLVRAGDAVRSGSGARAPDFAPLTIDLDLNSGLTALLKNIATGKHFPSIELKGVLADGQTVYDLRLGDVTVTSYHDTNSGHDILSFDYQQMSLTTTPQNPDGTLGTPANFSFDLTTDTQDVSIPAPNPAGSPSAAHVQSYYLVIGGMFGDSAAHAGAFDISSYTFDVAALASAASGSSKPSFQPLAVKLDLNSGLTALLKDIATGSHIPAIAIKGVSADGQTVYDLRLGDVTVTSYFDTNSGHDDVVFNYQRVSLTTTPQNPDGSLGRPVTFGYDIPTGTTDAVIPDPHPAGTASGGDAQSYHLIIDGMFGDSATQAGAFDVVDYTFNVGMIESPPLSGNFQPSFQPLRVDLDLNSGFTALLKDIATGKHIPSIELKGASPDGQTVYDLVLGDVTLSVYQDASLGHDVLSFSYQRVSLTTTPQTSTGAPGTPVTFSYDISTATTDVSIPAPHPAGSPTGGDAPTYYLTIDGIVGDTINDAHKGAFDVSSYDFAVDAVTSAASGSSNPNFEPLVVQLDLNSGQTALLKDIATGKHIPSIELKGVLPNGDTVYDLKLGNVTVRHYADNSNTGSDFLFFDYQQVNLTTTAQTTSGGLGTPVTFSFDLATNLPDVTIPPPNVPAGNPSGSDAQSYYLTVDGIFGDSAAHNGAFDVLGYNFDIGVFAPGAKATFAPLDVLLDLDSAATVLLKDAATGKHIRSIELTGVSADGHTVYDLKLGSVTVSAYRDTNGHDDLSFSYQQVSLTTTAQNPDGTFGTPVTFDFNIATNSEGATIPDPVADQPPIAVDDLVAATTGIGGTASGNVLANDSDPDGNPLAVTPFSGAGAHGNLVLNADGSFSYTVTNLTGATGSHLHDVFTYTETDGQGGGASAKLDITLNRAPDVLDNIAGVKIAAVSTGNVFGNDADPDGDALSVTAVGGGNVGTPIAGTYGTLTLNSNGSYSYTANNIVIGQIAPRDIFHFTESDGHGGVVQSTLTFSILSDAQTYFGGVPGQTITAGNSKGVLDGSLGNQHLIGGNAADVLVGGGGNVLTGGNGPDQFVFKGNFGTNEITDFTRPDILQLEKSTFGSASNILAHYAANDGHGNTVITDPHDADNVIIIDHVSVNQLRASDFVLV